MVRMTNHALILLENVLGAVHSSFINNNIVSMRHCVQWLVKISEWLF